MDTFHEGLSKVCDASGIRGINQMPLGKGLPLIAEKITELQAANAGMRQALQQIAAFNGVDSFGHVAIARQAIREGE